MKQKRYEVVSFSHGLYPSDLTRTLNSYALAGWRFHSIQQNPRGDRLIFERDWDSDETPAGLR